MKTLQKESASSTKYGLTVRELKNVKTKTKPRDMICEKGKGLKLEWQFGNKTGKNEKNATRIRGRVIVSKGKNWGR